MRMTVSLGAPVLLWLDLFVGCLGRLIRTTKSKEGTLKGSKIKEGKITEKQELAES